MPPTVSVGSIIMTNDPVFRPETFLLNLPPRGSRGYSDAYFHDYKPQDRAEGHWWGCSFKVTGRENVLKELYENGLGRRIEVWGYGLEPDFEARIYEIIFNYPPDKFTISLRTMNNSAHMRADIDDDGVVERTTVIQNTQSMDLYGQVDGVMSGGELASVAVADQTIQALVDLRALPKPSAQFQQGRDEMYIEVYCRGYVTTLEQRLYNQTTLTGTQSLNSQVEDIVGTRVALVSLLDELKQYYTLDEASAGTGAVTRSDKSGNGMHLTDGNTVPSVAAKQGNGADFESTNSEWLGRASEAGLQPGTDMSLVAWVKFESLASGMHVVSKWGAAPQLSYAIYLDTVGPNLEFWVSNNGTATANVTNSTVIVNDVWYFVYAYHDSANDLLGISINNGTPTTLAHTTGVYAAGTSEFCIGRQATGTLYLDGVVDEVGRWDRLLTANELSALYNGGVGRTYNDFASGSAVLEGVGEFIETFDHDANTTPVTREYDVDRHALGIVMDIARLGDDGNNRWLFGVKGRDCTTALGRKATLHQASPVKPPLF